jgi:hypothetical protein
MMPSEDVDDADAPQLGTQRVLLTDKEVLSRYR